VGSATFYFNKMHYLHAMIVIVDYGMGNIHSVGRRLAAIGAECVVSADHETIHKATKLILPGVGHFGKAMMHLKQRNLIPALQQAVIEEKKPILGICLGMQLMTRYSEEGNSEGLGWFDCKTELLTVNDRLRFKIPHTGWNSIRFERQDSLLEGVSSGSEMYFVHRYGVYHAAENEVLTYTDYETPFVSALRKDNIIGMQFHPEKSHDQGLQLLKNFVDL
jgi:glutamine amidotransferase